MSKTILYRLFRLGSIPKEAKVRLEKEGVVLLEEGIGGSVTFKKFRAPGKYYSWRRQWFSGSIVLTQDHLLAFKYSQPIIGVSWQDEKFKELDIQLENATTLCITFEASTFHPEATGEITVRFLTLLAGDVLQQIEHYTT